MFSLHIYSTMRIITIVGTITAALNRAAYHFTDVQALNAAQVIDVGLVFLLHNFANMKGQGY